MKNITAWMLIVAMGGHSATALAQARSADQFHNVKLMVSTGDKSSPTDAVIILDKDTFVVRSENGAAVLKTFPYATIKSAEYSYSKSPRWKSAIGVAMLCIVCGVATAFMKGKKHWMTVGADGDYALLQLDKANYKQILPAFEARSGVNVVTVADSK